MRRSTAICWASELVYAAVILLLAALGARPAAAQGLGYAAVSISPSTLKCSEEKGTTTEASVEGAAVHYCQVMGPNDCKVYGVMNACVAVATQPNPVPNHFGVGSGATREAAAAQALAACAKAGGVNCVVQFSPCSGDNPIWSGSPLPLPPGGKAARSILRWWAFGSSTSTPASGYGRSQPMELTPCTARPRIIHGRMTGRLAQVTESTRCTPS